MGKNHYVSGLAIFLASMGCGIYLARKNWIEPAYMDATLAAFAQGKETPSLLDFWFMPHHLGQAFGSGLFLYLSSVFLGFLAALPFYSTGRLKDISKYSTWFFLLLIFSLALLGIDA